MDWLLLFLQTVLCMKVVFSQEPAQTFHFSNVQPIFKEITGLPSNQKGFIITHPNYQPDQVSELTVEQKAQIKVQEDFRRAVAEANKQRIHGGEITASQEIPFTEETAPTSFNQRSDIDILEQQLPAEKERTVRQLQQPSSIVNFQSLRVPETELILPTTENFNVDEETLPQQFDAKKFREQAENARYSFKSAVADSVNDNTQIRQESRDGLKLAGLYSYSDGYFKRTVHYVADEHGYRIAKEEIEPIGNGPRINPEGKVDVSTQVAGSSLQYTIKGENLPPPKHKRESKNSI